MMGSHQIVSTSQPEHLLKQVFIFTIKYQILKTHTYSHVFLKVQYAPGDVKQIILCLLALSHDEE